MQHHGALLLIWLLAGPPGWLAAPDLRCQGLVTDVPHRGAIVYARTTEQFRVTAPTPEARIDWVIPSAFDGGHEWRYLATAVDAPAGFEHPTFDASAWSLGRGEFGPDVATDARQRTEWRSTKLCLRTTIDLGTKKPRLLWLIANHDDGLRVWLNGALVVGDDGYGRGRHYLVSGPLLDAWQRGPNVLAASCTNIGGAQYFDLAVGLVTTLPPGVRSADELQASLTGTRELAARAQSDLFGAFRPPPLLLQGDLDAGQQRVRIAPGDLRDLGWWLAMDLSCGTLGGALQLDASRLFRLGDLLLKGRATAVDADGWQTLEVSVKNTAEPAVRGDSRRHVDRHVRPFVLYGFDGRLRVQRRMTVRDGKARVEEFTSDLTGRIQRGKDWKDLAADLHQRENWRVASVRDNQDAEFRAMVQNSLTRGTAQLRQQLGNLQAANLAADPPDATDSYHSGRLAIGLLALLKGGVPKDDEVVQRGFAELRRRTLVDTYSLGNAMMAIEALHAPSTEFADMKAGIIDRPRQRQVPPEDRAVLQQWADQLLQNVDTRVDPAYLLRFNYTRDARFDNSVNQYGLLGLYAAHLCGIEIPPTVWEAAANHLLASQCPEGTKVDLDLVDYRTHARRQAEPDAQFTVARSVHRACGWGYQDPKSDGELTPTWGSMTCAGITGLTICQAALQDYAGVKRTKLQNDATRARRDGFAWLAKCMTQRCHPGAIERQQHWIYYYLYGLERAALLSGIALIQDRDWYFEGAMVLVLAQNAAGDWPAELLWDDGIERNAMAILFLKQGTLPVLTGR